MSKNNYQDGWYLMCDYKKGMFSCERIVEFFALGAYEKFDFIPHKERGGVLGYIGNMLKIDKNGNYFPLQENDFEGEGLIKCVHVKNYKKGLVYIAVCNQHGHRLSRFIIPKDSIQFISSRV